MADAKEIVDSYRGAVGYTCDEGPKAIDGLERVATDLGYSDLEELLSDNSDIVESIWEGVAKKVSSDTDWSDALIDIAENFELEEIEDEELDFEDEEEDDDWD